MSNPIKGIIGCLVMAVASLGCAVSQLVKRIRPSKHHEPK